MLVAIGFVSSLALGATRSAPGTTPPRGGTLRIAAPFFNSFDPALRPRNAPAPTGLLPYGLLEGTCATLMSFRDAPAPGGYQVRPEAAVGPPKVSRDRRTYVFTLRRGLRFSDGSTLSGANFVEAFNRLLDPAMGSRGLVVFSDVKRVTAGGRRVRIELHKPSGDLSTRVATIFACPVPLGFPHDPAGVPLTVGSGPYYPAAFVQDKLLVLERNPKYRGPRPRRVEKVVLSAGGNIDDNIRKVEEGDAEVFCCEMPRDVREVLAGRYGVNKRQFLRIGGTFVTALTLNTTSPLFRNNASLRKAVNFALDRPAILRRGFSSRGFTPTDQIVPSWVPGWVNRRIYPVKRPNLRRATRLAKGHLRDGKAVLYMPVGDPYSTYFPDQEQVIAQNLGRLGLEVELKTFSLDVLNAKASTPGEPYDMLLMAYTVDYPDPANVLIRLLAGENARKPAGNSNYAYFDDPRYNRRMAAANRLPTGPARMRAFSRIDADIMRDEAPWAPLFEGSQWLFISKRVGCFRTHPLFRLDYPAVCLR
jgi:peptide/nickel transport system substrate-binding protein